MKIKTFIFNPFYENTYVLSDESGECVIIDPGCLGNAEESELREYIDHEKLRPVHLLNTHCHIDHILGNHFVTETYQLPVEAHEFESDNVNRAGAYAMMFGLDRFDPPAISKLLNEGDQVRFGNTTLEILFTPGHPPGHVVFYEPAGKTIMGGDVLFRESIGRTDLPGGDSNTLIRSIQTRLFTLPDETTVYPGHGPKTTIGYEKQYNPFVQEVIS